ncbi:MAG: UvrD-helicase domain-containing protein [Candidatus Competibacter sp.]
MSKNKLIVAAAGSGKTTCLIEKALEQNDGKVLITTYTQANEAEIRCKIIQANKCIPGNITVQTWFSFLMQHGVKPYQGCLFEKRINGLILVNSASGVKHYTKNKGTSTPIFFNEKTEFEQHYFTRDIKIYSDKLSKFVIRCNEKTNGALIDRLSRVYPYIFIDEIQDLAGYDLELIKLLFNSDSNTLLVGDPRQGTYSTNSSLKNKKYRKSGISDFFLDLINKN